MTPTSLTCVRLLIKKNTPPYGNVSVESKKIIQGEFEDNKVVTGSLRSKDRK